MNKIAVFGKPGGGKSTLSKKLSAVTGVKLYALDSIKYKRNGEPVSPEEYSKEHAYLMDIDSWIIEGLGTLESFWLRIDAADTLIFIDLPYYVHYWWVTNLLSAGYAAGFFGNFPARDTTGRQRRYRVRGCLRPSAAG